MPTGQAYCFRACDINTLNARAEAQCLRTIEKIVLIYANALRPFFVRNQQKTCMSQNYLKFDRKLPVFS
jgi:hypothetical protein